MAETINVSASPVIADFACAPGAFREPVPGELIPVFANLENGQVKASGPEEHLVGYVDRLLPDGVRVYLRGSVEPFIVYPPMRAELG